MSKIDDLLAKAASAKPEHKDVPVVVAGELVTLRFYRLDPFVWASLTATHLPRPDVSVDSGYGYNVHEVSRHAAYESGRMVDGDSEETLTVEQWTRMFTPPVLSGHEVGQIVDAIWTLNEYAPGQLVDKLKKASTSKRGRKRS